MESVISDSFDVTTLLGSKLGLSTLLPVSFVEEREFTLNNHLNIFPNETFSTLPKLRYFGVGIKGCYNADDDILVSAYNPSRSNMNLYQFIPIRCVPVDEDLSDSERVNYRLRQRKTINGVEYFLYYLKVLEFGDAIKFKRINPLTGLEEAYELDSSYLSPTPVKPSTNTTVTSSTSSVVAYNTAKVALSADEVLEYINVAYNGDTRYARISEIGFFTGVDKVVTGTSSQNVSIDYTEAIYTQLFQHLCYSGISLSRSGVSLDSTFEITSSGIITEA